MRAKTLRILFGIIAHGCVIFAQSSNRQQPSPTASKNGTEKDFIVGYWKRIREGSQAHTEIALASRIKNSGLAFVPTCKDLWDFRSAGASEAFLTVLTKTSSARNDLRPVSKDEIMAWLSLSSTRIAEEKLVNRIGTCGLTFDPTEEDSKLFGRNGASQSLLIRINESRPLDKDAILAALNDKPENLINRIRTYGIILPRDFADISEAGGQPELFAAMLEARWYTKPKVPLAPKKGRFVVVCQPLDCTVEVNGSPGGPTRSNAFTAVIEVGQVTISVKRDGFDATPAEGRIVNIAEDDVATAVFHLVRKKGNAGGERLKEVTAALGGLESRTKSAALHVIGTIRCGADPKGAQPIPLEADMQTAAPSQNAGDTGIFHLGPNGKQAIMIRGNGGFAPVKGRTPKGFDEARMQACLTALQDSQFAKIISSVEDGAFAVSVDGNGPDDRSHLTATSPANTYRIALDANSRPIEVRYEGAAFGVGSRVVYEDYVEISGGYLPKQIKVIPADAGRQPAVEVSLSRIAYSTAVPK